MTGIHRVSKPENEKIMNFSPGTEGREHLNEELAKIREDFTEIPLIIGGEKIKTGETRKCILPHDNKVEIGEYHCAGKEEIEKAIEVSLKARERWAGIPWENRLKIFLKAAELMAKKYRIYIDALVMQVHSKNIFQAEIDVAELIDFWRFNAYFAWEIYNEQPENSDQTAWNEMDYRPLEGFVFAIPPFNFFSIGGNLSAAPAMMGNVVLWKPSRSAVYSNYAIMEILEEAGLPAGVINFVAGDSKTIGEVALSSPRLAGIHYTGSTEVFRMLWKKVGENIEGYRNYPRIVGETGGKDFIFVHNSADVKEVVASAIRGAFEYQGQKCSATSRAYIPQSLWEPLWGLMKEEMETIKMGTPENFSNFVNAVINKGAFNNIVRYIELAKNAEDAEIIYGGGYDSKSGYFIEPTVIRAYKPDFVTMEEEIFGPVLTMYVYPDEKYEETLRLCDATSPYGLTGSIFAKDREAITLANKILRYSAGNYYINDKTSGAVVSQQPFGGARASGTNDKAGSWLNLTRWVNPRTIKENFSPPRDYRYPFLSEE